MMGRGGVGIFVEEEGFERVLWLGTAKDADVGVEAQAEAEAQNRSPTPRGG